MLDLIAESYDLRPTPGMLHSIRKNTSQMISIYDFPLSDLDIFRTTSDLANISQASGIVEIYSMRCLAVRSYVDLRETSANFGLVRQAVLAFNHWNRIKGY